jgi:hypothetical protein
VRCVAAAVVSLRRNRSKSGAHAPAGSCRGVGDLGAHIVKLTKQRIAAPGKGSGLAIAADRARSDTDQDPHQQ